MGGRRRQDRGKPASKSPRRSLFTIHLSFDFLSALSPQQRPILLRSHFSFSPSQDKSWRLLVRRKPDLRLRPARRRARNLLLSSRLRERQYRVPGRGA